MPEASVIDEAVLPKLLAAFYGSVRRDDLLGSVFNDAVHDWDEHLQRTADFWSSVMLTTGRYKGNPVAKHLALRDRITPAMFDRWLALWSEATETLMPAPAAKALQDKAGRIAESLQLAIRFQTPLQRTMMDRQDRSA